jgi:hypothetical protein
MRRRTAIAAVAAALAGAACGPRGDSSAFRDAHGRGRELVEAVRRADGATLAAALGRHWPGPSDAGELAAELAALRDEHGALAEPALFDVKALADEDLGEGAPAGAEAVRVYAAMLSDGSGRSGARGVDVTLDLVHEGGALRLAAWAFEPLFDEHSREDSVTE